MIDFVEYLSVEGFVKISRVFLDYILDMFKMFEGDLVVGGFIKFVEVIFVFEFGVIKGGMEFVSVVSYLNLCGFV